jgi:hypothetical protein
MYVDLYPKGTEVVEDVSTIHTIFAVGNSATHTDDRGRNPNEPPSNRSKRGIFEQAPNETLVLLLDFKSNSLDLLTAVQNATEPLRQNDYLSFWNGEHFITRPITIVLTGKAPYNTLIGPVTHRDLLFDAPLADLQSQSEESKQWDRSNAYYASTSFAKSFGSLWTWRFSPSQMEKLRGQIKAAKQQRLKVRYWDTPAWPTSLRNHVWRVLLEEGADVLNFNDLHAAAFMDWSLARLWVV